MLCAQIDLGGREHSLYPLAAACPNITVIDTPRICGGALWLPYRRDHGELQEAISAAGDCLAIFAHADVVRSPCWCVAWTGWCDTHVCMPVAAAASVCSTQLGGPHCWGLSQCACRQGPS